MTRKTAIKAVVAAIAYPIAKQAAQERASAVLTEPSADLSALLVPRTLSVSFDHIKTIEVVIDGKTHTITGNELAEALMSHEPHKTEWVGHPMVSDNDPYTPSQGWLPGVQIGLRPDGSVVWRSVK